MIGKDILEDSWKYRQGVMKEHHIDDDTNEPIYDGVDLEIAFRDGIDWFVNNLWHDGKEEPLKNKPLLVLYKQDGITYQSTCSLQEGELWSEFSVTKWCYIEDLLDRKWVKE